MSNIRKLEGRVPFYIHRPDAPEAQPPAVFASAADYLEAAIANGAGDELLSWLDSGQADDSVGLLECHRQLHGDVPWRDCRSEGCRKDYALTVEVCRLWLRLRVLRGAA